METELPSKKIIQQKLTGLLPDPSPDTLLSYATPLDKTIILTSSAFAIFAGALNPLVTVLYGQFVHVFSSYSAKEIAADHMVARYSTLALYFVYLAIATFLCVFISTVGFYYSGERTVRRLRQTYFRSILRQNMAFYDNLVPSEISARIMIDMDVIQEALTNRLSHTVTAIAKFCSAFVIAFIMYWKLALVLFPTFVLTVVITIVMGAEAVKNQKLLRIQFQEASGIAQEALQSVRQIYAFGIQDLFTSKYHSGLVHAGSYETKARRATTILSSWLNTMPYLIYPLGFWAGLFFFLKGELSIANFTTCALTTAIGSFALAKISPAIHDLLSSMASASVILRATASRSLQDPLESGGTIPESLRGDLEFSAVSLVYPSRGNTCALKKVSFKCKAKTTTVILGASGSGKTSVLNLLQRFYEPVEGQIFLDGQDILTYNLRWMRSQIAVVEQTPVLFNTTIFENIRFGVIGTSQDDDNIEERVVMAANEASIHDFIMSLPDQYQTQVGEQGVTLSGGQLQRMAIARALIRNPRILLLDEPTASLDPKSEANIQQALDHVADQRTTIIITHRLNTVREAHQIIVLSHGKIVEQGLHTELLKQNGSYALMLRGHKYEAALSGGDRCNDNYRHSSRRPTFLAGPNSDQIVETIICSTKKGCGVSQVKRRVKGNFTTNLSFIAKLNGPDKKPLTIGMIGATTAGLVIPAQSIVFAKILAALGDFAVSENGLRTSVNFWSGIYLALAFAAFSSNMAFGLAFACTTERCTRRLRYNFLRNLLSQNISFFDKSEYQVAELMNLLNASVQDMAALNGPVLGSLVTFMATLTGGIVISLAIGWKLALVCIATIPVVVTCGWIRLRTLSSLNTLTRRRGQEAAAYASELVGCIRTVASLGVQDSVIRQYSSLLVKQWEKSLSSILYGTALYAASQSSVYLCAALAFWYGGGLLQAGEYSLFQFYVCFAAVISGSQQAGIIASSAPDVSKAMHATAELMNILGNNPLKDSSNSSRLDGLDSVEKRTIGGQLEVCGVSFRYPSRPDTTVLNNISIEAVPGQFVAIVGPSGCGKSTLISLIERFYNPDNGAILMDRRNISTLDTKNYRQCLGLVSQNSFLYSSTLRENITLGLQDGNASDEDILEVCRQADIYDFVSSLPDGLSTSVGANGCMLSGGQRQRVAIARALLRNPSILLLDEATSALDIQSEAEIIRALRAAGVGRTTIFVTHRLRTVVHADIIFVVEDGVVIEKGTHEELTKFCGRYHEYVKMQSFE